MRSLAGIPRIKNREVSEGGGTVNKIKSDTDCGRGFNQGVFEPCPRGVDIDGCKADVRGCGSCSTGASNREVGEIRGFIIGVIGVVQLVDIDTPVHGIGHGSVLDNRTGIAAVICMADHDSVIGFVDGEVGEQRLTVLDPNSCCHGPSGTANVVHDNVT